jgi:Fe2+ transport system protein B
MEFYLKLNLNLEQENQIITLEINDEEQKDLIDSIYKKIEQELNIPANEFVLQSNNGRMVTSKTIINNKDTLGISPLLLGGKGGFGSLLRAFGKQITKSTNKEACRDLTGRRIRHVNNEKKLKDFLEKQNDLAKQKEEKKRERVEKRKKKKEKLESSHHLFVDPKYDEQKQKISQDLNKALEIARKQTSSKEVEACTSSSVDKNVELDKIIHETDEKKALSSKSNLQTKSKTNEKFQDWMGVGDFEVSSSDEEEEVQVKSMYSLFSYQKF